MDTQTLNTFFTNAQNRLVWFFRTYGLYVLMGIGVLVVLLLVFAFITFRALPGQSLYGVKTKVFEPIAHAVRVTPGMQAAYSAHVLERRLRELQALSTDTATSTPEALNVFAALVQKEVRRADDSLGASSMSPESALDLHLKILSATDANQTLTRSNAEFAPVEEMIEDARGDAYRAFNGAVHDFASTSPEAAGSYVGEQLRLLEGEITTIARGSDAEVRALARLSDAQDAISEGNVGDALVFVLRARQAIAVDRYLFDSERGPEQGAPMPQPTTEGQ